MLMRSEPFREFDRIAEAMLGERRPQQMPVDAYRRGNEFTVLFDLPGVDPRFIEVTVEKDLVTVRATRGWVRTEGDQIQIAERVQGEFSRQLFLGEGLDRDHISATYENGVLRLTIPVSEEAKPRKVEITNVGDIPHVEITNVGDVPQVETTNVQDVPQPVAAGTAAE
jgi:HSP20 family protein